jgi:hypothetical protein
MFSDDLFRSVTFQTRCTGVPTDHVTHGIQLENGILLNFLDKQTRALLALSEQSLLKLTISDVFEGHSQEVSRERQESHGINPLPYTFVTVGNLSQIPLLAWAKLRKPRGRDWYLQELGEVSQRSAKEHLGCRPGHFCGGGIGINNLE